MKKEIKESLKRALDTQFRENLDYEIIEARNVIYITCFYDVQMSIDRATKNMDVQRFGERFPQRFELREILEFGSNSNFNYKITF